MDALRNNAEREIAHLAAAARGAVGVAALHLENGRALAHDADASYPMASTVKVPRRSRCWRRRQRGGSTLPPRSRCTLRK